MSSSWERHERYLRLKAEAEAAEAAKWARNPEYQAALAKAHQVREEMLASPHYPDVTSHEWSLLQSYGVEGYARYMVLEADKARVRGELARVAEAEKQARLARAKVLGPGLVVTAVFAVLATLLAPSLEPSKPLSWPLAGALGVAPLAVTAVMVRRFTICAERRDWLRLWIALGLGALAVAGAALVGSLTGVGWLPGAALGLVALAPWWALTSVWTASWSTQIRLDDRRLARWIRVVSAVLWALPILFAVDRLVTLLGVER